MGVNIYGKTTNVHHTHPQLTSASIWTIDHGLGYKPNVTVVDSSDRVVYGEIEYIDLDSLVISFGAPFAGYAYCS